MSTVTINQLNELYDKKYAKSSDRHAFLVKVNKKHLSMGLKFGDKYNDEQIAEMYKFIKQLPR